MRRALLVFLLSALFLAGCKKSAPSQPEFTADIRIVAPFTPESPIKNGKLYFSKGRLRVDLNPLVFVYVAEQQRGWGMFPGSKLYWDIGQKDVSTYLPPMTNGSPCPNSDHPSDCKMVGRETINDRVTTKWELVNQHGVRIYLWTDDKLPAAIRWNIENVTYDLNGIREEAVQDDLFTLPAGYTKAPAGTFLDWKPSVNSSQTK